MISASRGSFHLVYENIKNSPNAVVYKYMSNMRQNIFGRLLEVYY